MDANDIKALAKAVSDLHPPTVQAVTIKLPEFWPDDPEVWFARAEAQMNTRGITVDTTKFDHIVTALDNSAASEVKSVLVNPPAVNKYEALKKALLDAFSRSQAQKDAELLALSGLGDRKPTALLRKIRNLNSDAETLRRALFLAQLPSEVRGVLAGQEFATLEKLAEAADRIVEARQSGGPPAAFAVSSRDHSNKPPPASTSRSDSNVCSYHSRFGLRARSCRPGCLFASLLHDHGDRSYSSRSNPPDYRQPSENSRAGR